MTTITPECPFTPPSPEVAGALTWEKLEEMRAAFPYLRPCPRSKGARGSWFWVSVKACAHCAAAVGKRPEPQTSLRPPLRPQTRPSRMKRTGT